MQSSVKQFLWQWRAVLLTSPTIAIVIILLRFTGLLQSWEWAAYDQFLRLRPPEQKDSRIAIVGINEADVKKIGQAIIPDQVYADVINKLNAMQPAAIGLDIYRDQPVEPGHQNLLKIFETTPNIVGIEKVVGERDRDIIPGPPKLKEKGQTGSNDLIQDADKKVRRGLIDVQNNNDETIYSFPLYLALLYLDKKGISPQPIDGTNNWKLGKMYFTPFEPNNGGYVRADARGSQILLNYRSGNQPFEIVSLSDILENKVPPNWAQNRIILIGTVGESFKDVFFTPYSSNLISLPVLMPGVEIHAHLTSQIISTALNNRNLIKTWPEFLEWFWILLWSTLGAIITWKYRYLGGIKTFPVQRLITPIIISGMLIATTYLALCWGWWVPVVPPILALAGSTITITAYIARSAGDIRKTFGRYLNDAVVANILENPEGLKLGGERRKITIFTSDLRGFTALSERLSPEEVVKILNFYLGYMADVITHYQGTIDEFMGDGILVLFGAPTSREDDAKRAIACAVAMQQAMDSVNAKMKEWNLPALEMGIGINTGEVVVGNIGSEKRTKYGIVGSQVNLTYRIESYTTGNQILISESTLKEAGDIVKIETERQVQPKGVPHPIMIYEVAGIGGKYNLLLKKEEEIFFTLPQPLLLQYVLIEGKDVGDVIVFAKLIKLSPKSAEIYPDQTQPTLPSPLTNLKINLFSNTDSSKSEDIYAKVLEKPTGEQSFYIRFTSKSPKVATQLDELYKTLKNQ